MSKSERNVRPVSVIERIFDTTAFPSSVDESSVYRTSAWAVAKALCAIALSCTRVTYFRTIFTAGRTKVVPSKRPELRCNSTRTRSWPVSSFLTAPKIATAALVRVRSFIHPCEFSADFVDAGIGARHSLISLRRSVNLRDGRTRWSGSGIELCRRYGVTSGTESVAGTGQQYRGSINCSALRRVAAFTRTTFCCSGVGSKKS
jgi:hypothetical protein